METQVSSEQKRQTLIEDAKAEIRLLLRENAKNWLKISRRLVEIEDWGGELDDAEFAGLPKTDLRNLGKGILVEEAADLVLSRSAVTRRLARLSPFEQKTLLSGARDVEVVIPRGDGWDKVEIPLLRLSYPQLRQVFASDHHRSYAEQIIYLQNLGRPKAHPPDGAPIKVEGNRVIILRPDVMTKRQLLKLLGVE